MLATVVTGALIASAAVLGAAAPAHAAVGDVDSGSGSLSWGIRESLRNYVGNQTAALPNEGGAAPIGTRNVPSGGATFNPATTPIPAQTNVQERLPYLFPVAGGAVTDANNLTVALGGAVQYWFPSHNFDIRFSDLKVVVANGVATIVGDLSLADVSWTGSAWNVAAPTVGNDIVIATVGSVAVDVNAAAGTVSVTGTNVAFTQASAEVFYAPLFNASLYNAGDPMDDFTVTAAYATTGGGTPTPQPTISVSKSQISQTGDTVTVTGSGFDPTLLGNGAPVANQPAGFYVAIGSFADNWRLTEGHATSTRPNIAQKWALPEPPLNSSPALSGSSYTKLNADGTFTAEITIPGFDPETLANGAANFGVYTYSAGTRAGAGTTWTLTPADWAARAPFETFTPLAVGGTATDINVNVPTWVDQPTGSFNWAFASQTPANLGVATQQGANFVASGSLSEIIVTDNRAGALEPYNWSISGQTSDFTSGSNTFAASYLGWTPELIEGETGVAAGAATTSSQLGGTGLGASSVLATSTAAASARLGAELNLVIPGTTPAGDYKSKLTITALSN